MLSTFMCATDLQNTFSCKIETASSKQLSIPLPQRLAVPIPLSVSDLTTLGTL